MGAMAPWRPLIDELAARLWVLRGDRAMLSIAFPQAFAEREAANFIRYLGATAQGGGAAARVPGAVMLARQMLVRAASVQASNAVS